MTQPMEPQAPRSNNPQCTMCGSCLEVCPVFSATNREELSPRAKGLLVRELASADSGLRLDSVKRLASLCVGCGKCAQVCPQGVNLLDELAKLKHDCPGFAEWAWKTLMASAKVSFPLGLRLTGGFGLAQATLLKAPRFFLRIDRPVLSGPVLLFPGCTAKFAAKARTTKAVQVLKTLGATEVVIPDWACCGLTLDRAGLFAERDKARLANLNLWRKQGRGLIITFCATCQTGLEAMDQADIPWESGERELWQKSLKPLDQLIPIGSLHLESAPDGSNTPILYHQPCHATKRFEAFLKALPEGGKLVNGQCCGFGGVLQIVNPDLSREVAKAYWEGVKVPPGGLVLTGCSGCVLQLSRTKPQGISVAHWLDTIS